MIEDEYWDVGVLAQDETVLSVSSKDDATMYASGGVISGNPGFGYTIDDLAAWKQKGVIPSYSYLSSIPAEPKEWVVPPHQCPHCQRDRHDGPLTANVAWMFDNHSFRANYDPAEDKSEIVCIGSDFYGPARPNRRAVGNGYVQSGSYCESFYDKFVKLAKSYFEFSLKLSEWTGPKWEINVGDWFIQSPPASTGVVKWELPEPKQGLEINLELWDEWDLGEQKPMPGEVHNALPAVNGVWHQVTKTEIPTLESAANYDHLVEQLNKPYRKALPAGKKKK